MRPKGRAQERGRRNDAGDKLLSRQPKRRDESEDEEEDEEDDEVFNLGGDEVL
jgi:hypothetical protein